VTVDYTQPPQTPPQKKSSGCGKAALIGCSIILVLFVLGCCVLVFVVFGAVKSTDLYKGARDRAVNDPRVIAAIGPSHAGWWVRGSVEAGGGSGSGTVSFPLKGTKDDAIVRATATRRGGAWEYSELVVTPRHGPPIDLLRTP
jgi:hypothetical protein